MSRHLESASLYARELGIRKRLLMRLGGEHYLRSLDPDARAILIKPNAGNSRAVDKGGLRARGMRTRVRGIDSPGFLIPPHVLSEAPIECAMTEEYLREFEGSDG